MERHFPKWMNVPHTPKWVTPERQAYLAVLAKRQVMLAQQGYGMCVCGHRPEEHQAICQKCWDRTLKLITKSNQKAGVNNTHVVTFTRGHARCPFGDSINHCALSACNYDIHTDWLIKDWSQQDEDTRRALAEYERHNMHYLGVEPTSNQFTHGRFGTVSREITGDNQEIFYIVGFGMSGVTNTPFAKVRLSSSNTILHVDLKDTLRTLSVNKRRKIIRHADNIPFEVAHEIHELCLSAVNAHLAE